MLWARALADFVVVVHAAYVAFVVLGLAATLLGLALGWGWVRNFWFRAAHLGAIGLVVVESLAKVPCPLTVWEAQLRRIGGQTVVGEDFVAGWIHRLIFFQADPWVFTALYVAFAAAVLLTFVLGPPRRPGRWAASRGAVGG